MSNQPIKTATDVANLMKDAMFITTITSTKDDMGVQTVSPLQDLIERRIRALVPRILPPQFNEDFNEMRKTTTQLATNEASNSLNIWGLKPMDGERNIEQILARQLMNADKATNVERAKIRSILDFMEAHISNGESLQSGLACFTVKFLTGAKKSAFEKTARGNLRRGLPYMSMAFKSPQDHADYYQKVSLREKFPSAWSNSITIIRDVLKATKDNEPNLLKGFRVTNKRKSPGVTLTLQEGDKRIKVSLDRAWILTWDSTTEQTVETLKQHTEKRTFRSAKSTNPNPSAEKPNNGDDDEDMETQAGGKRKVGDSTLSPGGNSTKSTKK